MRFGNPAAERAALERTYEDTAAISRAGKVQAGELTIAAPDEPVYTGVACGLSMVGDRSAQTAAQQSLRFDAVLFVPPETRVLPGDFVAVRRFGRERPAGGTVIAFQAVGLPKEYATHTEVLLKGRDLT